MDKLITLPDGNAVSPEIIKSVFFYKDKGVICRDAQQRVVTFISIPSEELGLRVRDLLILAKNGNPKAMQADWSFLKEQTAD